MLMDTVKYLVGTVAVLTLGGCAVDSGGSTQSAEGLAATQSEQALTAADCQGQVASCVKAAKSFVDLGGCTTKFQSCTAQAALDLASQSNLLKNCRAQSDSCLTAALTPADIKACRTRYQTCASDVQSTATDGLAAAVAGAKEAFEKAAQTAAGVIHGATSAAGDALGALSACTTAANQCLSDAVVLKDITVCQTSFQTCAGSAVALVDEIVAPLPVPTPTEIASTLGPCQDRAKVCLAHAITLTDIGACKGTLQTCVKGVTTLGDSTVDQVNKLLPPIIQLPTPGNAVDCTAATTDCLLKLGNPLDCAAGTAKCLGA
jgi:hypothetical protein